MKPHLLKAIIASLFIGSALGVYFANTSPSSPLEGYFIIQKNGIPCIDGVAKDSHKYHLTNWLCVTSDSSPKIIMSYLIPPRNSAVKAGQVWVSADACFINTPEIFIRPAESNTYNGFTLVTPEYKSTNDWPALNVHTALIYVHSIEKASAGRVNGLDYYAYCYVRFWNDAGMSQSYATLLLSGLTNTATLLE